MTKLFTVEDTLAWGAKLAETLQAGDVVGLVGTLGAGKTHATKGIVAGLGSNVDVSSPTFTLVHEYNDGRLPIFHFDFYRLESEEEVLGVGWDDFFAEDGVIIVEWADLYPSLLPANTRWFQFQIQPDGSREVAETSAPC